MERNSFSEYGNFSFNKLINYIQNNYKQLILIILVFIIIYIVDCINSFNMKFLTASIPGIPGIPLMPGSNIPGSTSVLSKAKKSKNRKK